MSKVSFTSLMALCAALAACSDTNPTAIAPDDGPALSEASADLRGGVTADGPFDLVFTTADGSVQMAAARQAATAGRASGHVAFDFSPAFLGIASEQYSFVALGTAPLTPFAAKGQYAMMLTTTTGVTQKFHGDVICMSTVGNTTRISGQLTKVWVNNVQRPINPLASHNIWTVTDNGEGQGTTDTASPMIFFPAAGAQFHCATGFTPPQFPTQDGNIQVQP